MKSIQQIILDLSESEGFSTVVLTNTSGLPLATSPDVDEAHALAAVVAEMPRISTQATQRLGLGENPEVLFLSTDAQRGLLCRQFSAGGKELILALMIRPQHAYWQATSQAIRKIQAVWES
jgi:predicted regulator of Ras-like GTPase activity (Roadblock/LC7/MglB family)